MGTKSENVKPHADKYLRTRGDCPTLTGGLAPGPRRQPVPYLTPMVGHAGANLEGPAMTNGIAIALVLAGVLVLAGCRMHFDQARPDATPFEVADDECWDFSGSPARGDPDLSYEKCMARHGWASCGPANPCTPDAR